MRVGLAVRVEVTEAVNAGGSVCVGVGVEVDVAVKVGEGSALLVDVTPPVSGIITSRSSLAGCSPR